MKQLLLSAVLAAGINLAAHSQSTWSLDASHSNVRFNVTHLVVSEVEGSFRKFNATVSSPTEDFNNAKIEFTIDVNSVFTDNEQRDAHLKGDDFFNAEKYPQMKFVSTSVKKVSGKNYVVEGNLTIRDVTKKVKFDVVYGGTVKDPWGNIKAGFKASGIIKRMDYNLKWNTLTEAGGMVVSDEVSIQMNIELAKNK